MSDPKKHHYIPEFYLKRWAQIDKNNQCRVWYYKVINNTLIPDRISPENTGYEKYLYSLLGVSSQNKQHLEKDFFKKIDDKASNVLTKILSGYLSSLNINERNDWAKFLISLQIRNPISLKKLITDYKNGWDQIVNHADIELNEKGHLPNSMSIIKFVNEYCPNLPHDDGMMLLKRIIEHPTNITALVHMHWWINDFTNSSFDLVTSDNPLMIKFGDFNQIKTLIQIPLSPQIIFYASHNLNYRVQLSSLDLKVHCREINQTIIDTSYFYIYSKDRQHDDLIKNSNFLNKRSI